MVKDQSLFSYVAPGNIFAWILMPFRYFMPLRHFVWLNRTIIKATHCPLLSVIFLYEKYILAPSMYEPTDFIDNPGRGRNGARAVSIAPAGRPSLFSPTIRIREESVAGFQQDRALEEVFRRTPDFASLRTQRMHERKRTQNAVRNWMDQNDAIPESPNQLGPADRKLSLGREGPPRRRYISETRSIASDPAELISNIGFPMAADGGYFDAVDRRDHAERTILKDQDADDELVTNDEDEDVATASRRSNTKSETDEPEDYFKTPTATRFNDNMIPTSLDTSRSPFHQQVTSKRAGGGLHSRTMSSNTILFNPPKTARRIPDDNDISPGAAKTRSRPITARPTPMDSPLQRSPRRPGYLAGASRPRPIMPPRGAVHTTANIHRPGNGLTIDTAPGRRAKMTRRMSSSDLLDVQSDLAGVADHDLNAFGGVPSSFVTQMAMATGMITPGGANARHAANDKAQRERDNDRDRMSRLVLARMKTLEEGFADVVKEMRGLQRSSGFPSTAHNSASEGTGSSWHGEGEGEVTMRRPFAHLNDGNGARAAGGNGGAMRSKTGLSERPAAAGVVATAGAAGRVSRPGSRRSGDKSNRTSVILRSPVSSRGGDFKAKGKGKEVESPRHRGDSDAGSDSDAVSFGGVERMGFTRRGSSL